MIDAAPPDPEWEAEVLRVYRRFAREFVEALGICPWAEKARADGAVAEVVVWDRALDVAATVERARGIGRRAPIDIGLLIHPRLEVERRAFESFVAEVRAALAAERVPERERLAMAAFHPDAPPAVEPVGRLIEFVRRSPDPTIQLVRQAALDRVRRHDAGPTFIDPSTIDLATFLSAPARKAPLHERVAEINAETLRARGLERVDALLRDIRADRDHAYARFRATDAAPKVDGRGGERAEPERASVGQRDA